VIALRDHVDSAFAGLAKKTEVGRLGTIVESLGQQSAAEMDKSSARVRRLEESVTALETSIGLTVSGNAERVNIINVTVEAFRGQLTRDRQWCRSMTGLVPHAADHCRIVPAVDSSKDAVRTPPDTGEGSSARIARLGR
jgi:hypothetical protein